MMSTYIKIINETSVFYDISQTFTPYMNSLMVRLLRLALQ